MIEIIPAIDIIDGRPVRLSQGDYSRRTDYDLSVEDVARAYRDAGIRRLHIVDLDGAKASEPVNLAVLERVVAATALDVEFGGGVKSEQSLRSVLSAGARWVICGSAAVTAPDEFRRWMAQFGPEHVILGADVRNGKVATHGWLQEVAIGAAELIESFVSDGLGQVICTDISRDGMLQGPSTQMYVELQERFPQVDIIVSGGVGSVHDIAALDRAGLRAVITGKAIYEGKITLKELSRWLPRE